MNIKFPIIGLSEPKIIPSAPINYISLPVYSFRFDQAKVPRAGTGLLILESISFTKRNDF